MPPTAFTALSACLATLEPLDVGERHRVLAAITAALDLTTPRAVLAPVVPEPPRTALAESDVHKSIRADIIKPAKKVTPAKPVPKGLPTRKIPQSVIDRLKAGVLKELQEGPASPRVLGSQLSVDQGGHPLRLALKSLLREGRIVGSGTTNTRRYALAKG